MSDLDLKIKAWRKMVAYCFKDELCDMSQSVFIGRLIALDPERVKTESVTNLTRWTVAHYNMFGY